MECERFILKFGDGGEVDIPKTDLISLEVELDTEMASMFRLHLAIRQQRDGTWTYLDDEKLQAWQSITLRVGFDTGVQDLLSGYITHARPDFPPDRAQCSLEIWGLDGSVLMDQQEKLQTWVNKRDWEIASEIFGYEEYNFSSVVEKIGKEYEVKEQEDDTAAKEKKDEITVIQRETDIQFLRRLALRNGLECYVEGKTGYFLRPQIQAHPQKMLAVHFGEETNVNHFSIEVNGLTPTSVAMFQVNQDDKKNPLEVVMNAGDQAKLGTTGDADFRAHAGSHAGANKIPPGQVFVSMNVAGGVPEMQTLSQALFHQAEWFVTAEGEINGNRYQHVLRPHGTVIIKGVGETYSGVYYVTHVTHTFTSNGYTEFFRVKRNALMLTGKEDFTANSGRSDEVL